MNTLLKLFDKLKEIGFYIYEPNHVLKIENARNKANRNELLSQLQVEYEKKYINEIMNNLNIPFEIKSQLVYNIGKGYHEFMNIFITLQMACNELKKAENIDKIDNDWFSFFLDRLKIIESEEMKYIWSKVLAFSIDNEYYHSKSLINALTLMSKKECECFFAIAKYTFTDFEENDEFSICNYPMIFYKDCNKQYDSIITRQGLVQLHNFGLIEVNFDTGFFFRKNPTILRFYKYVISFKNKDSINKRIPSGNVLFTKNGNDLYEIINRHGIHTGETLTLTRDHLSCLGFTSEILKN